MTARKKPTPAQRRRALEHQAAQAARDADYAAAELGRLDDDDDPEHDVDAAIAELGAEQENAKVKVWREAEGRPRAFCRDYTAAEFARGGGLELVRQEFGPGRYRIQVCRIIEGRGNRLARNVAVEIAPLPGQRPGEPAPAAADLDAKLERMFERFALTQAQGQVELLKTILGSRGGSGDSITTIIDGVAKLRELSGPAKAAGDPIETFLRGVELAKVLGGGGDAGETSKWDVILELARSFKDWAPALATQPAAPARIPYTVEHDAPRADAAAPSNRGNGDMHPMLARVRPFLPMLAAKAAAGASPSLYAELVLDQVPDAQLDELVTLLRAEDWQVPLHQACPPLAQHTAWLEQLRAAILELLSEAGDLTEDAPTGDAARADPASGH